MPGEIRDIRMIQKAMEQRWPIKPEYRSVLVQRLTRIIADPQSTPREVTAAAKGLIAAESQNQKDEHARIDEFNDRILALARRCGVSVDLLGLGQAAIGDAAERDDEADVTGYE